MRSLVQNTRADGGDVGTSVEAVRQNGSSTSLPFAVSCSQRASLFFPPWRLHPFSSDEPSRISVPAGGLNSRPSTSSTSLATSGVRRNAGRQAKTQAAAQHPAAATLSGSSTSRRSAASSRARTDGSSETRNRRGASVLRVVRTVVEGMRRCVPRCSARGCQGIPLPRAVADVRHFLDALYYEEVCFLILRSCLAVGHTGVFLYSCILEKPFETHVTIALLAILAGLTLLRVLCQYQIVKALARLRWAWWQRTILPDFVKLLRSPLWQCQRILFLVSFSLYFVVLHLAYYGTVTSIEASRTPVLSRYLSLVVLVFLSALGPHILMLVVVCTSLVVCWCASAADFEQLLVEEPRAADRALPARLLQMMHEEQWTISQRDPRRSNNSDRGTNSSCRRGSDTTQGLNKQLQRQLSKYQRNLSAQTTGVSEADQERSGTRRIRCDRRVNETRGTDDGNEVNARIDFTCAICLTEFHEGDVVRRLPCSHVFHSACITRWLSSRATCPLRCYVNFFIGHNNQPPYDASRSFRMLASQLLRQRRIRFLASLRQRNQRHPGQQRPSSQIQHRQTQQRERAQGYQQDQDHHEELEKDQGEDHQDSVQHSTEASQVPMAVDPGAADACSFSAVTETQKLAEALGGTMASPAVAGEETEHVRVLKQSNEAWLQTRMAARRSLEGTSEGVGEVKAEEVPSKDAKNFVMLSCCMEDAGIKDDDSDRNSASRVAEIPLEKAKNSSAATETQNNSVKQQMSVHVARGACMSSFPGASIESTVVLSVSSAGGSSEDEFSETHVETYTRYTNFSPCARHSTDGMPTSM